MTTVVYSPIASTYTSKTCVEIGGHDAMAGGWSRNTAPTLYMYEENRPIRSLLAAIIAGGT